MQLKWASKALSDLARLHSFLSPVNSYSAAKVVQSFTIAADKLRANPRIGEKLEEFDLHEVRRVFVGDYEMRYGIKDATIYILRLWHTRENR
jgi:plasmid stabilization system protein ParE